MINNLLEFSYEFYIFIAVEAFLIIIYILFFKYSRKHGGVFDRRISERRSNNLNNRGRRFINLGFNEAYAVHSNSNEIFGIDKDRRVNQRRLIIDRRSI